MTKKIYRDFNHWWSEGNHGYSSASREYAKELWDDLEPTILASRDDYKNSYVQLMKDRTKRHGDIMDHLLEYIQTFAKEDAPRFWKWYLDQVNTNV